MGSNFNQTFHKKKTKNSANIIRIFLVIILGVTMLFLIKIALSGLSVVKNISQEILGYSIDLMTPKNIFIARQQLLETKVQNLEQQLGRLQLTEDENTSLRNLLNYPKLEQETIVARVIAKPSQNIYDRIVIDRGSRDGVAIGDKIIAGENGLIAVIDNVTETTAQGTLISGNFWKGDAIITRLGITVPVQGKGSGNFELHVPRDMDIRDGDIMTFPSAPHLIFGVIKSVQFDDRNPYQTVLARMPINVQELKFVRVLK